MVICSFNCTTVFFWIQRCIHNYLLISRTQKIIFIFQKWIHIDILYEYPISKSHGLILNNSRLAYFVLLSLIVNLIFGCAFLHWFTLYIPTRCLWYVLYFIINISFLYFHIYVSNYIYNYLCIICKIYANDTMTSTF